MRTILQYITADQYREITSMNTQEEIASLIWCVEHMPEELRGNYLQCFLGGTPSPELAAFMGVQELVTA
jgi:hypothetical protein